MTQVRIQSSSTFIEHLFTVCCRNENEEKEERPGMAYFKKTCSIGLSHSLFEFTASGYCVQYDKLDQFCPKQKFATQGRQIFSHHNSVSI